MSRSRNYIITWNVPHGTWKQDEIDTKGISYLVMGKEVGKKEKREHYQGYVELENAVTMKTLIRRLKIEGARVENKEAWERRKKRKTNPQKASEYCKKEDDDAFEIGVLSQQGKRTDLECIKEQILDGVKYETIADENFGQWCYHRKAFKEYAELKEPKRNWVTEVILVTGEAGTGKTRLAVEAGASQIEYKGGFVGGYDGEDVVVFDDIDEYTFTDRQFLLKLLDRYEMKVNVKGGWRNWKPRTIYLTSNFNMEELGWTYDAIKRRVTKVIELKNCTEENCTEVIP